MNMPFTETRAKPRLLILDDDSMTGITIQRAAQQAGFDSQYTTTAQRFFVLVSEWQPDVIALDLIMPDMDGVEVMSALAERNCNARVVITSGAGSRVLDAAARSANAHGLLISEVLAKPFSASQLRQALARALSYQASGQIRDPSQQSTSQPVTETLSSADLSQAIQAGRITTVYQPKVRTRTGTLVGFEALARWQHERLGPISPQQFVALAEQHDLIDSLTEHVMERALCWLADLPATLQERGSAISGSLNRLMLSLNVSARSLDNPALFEQLLTRCRELGIKPERIILEVTESSAMQNATRSLDNLTRLRLQGFQLSIDDFGTGYSSMLQLVRLPFSEIKIDQGFVMKARDSGESRAVIRAIVELARSLGLHTTAEGVEDRETLAYLREVGCDYAQGYLCSRPLTETQVLPWIANRAAASEQHRLEAVHGLDLLDTPAEARFDRFTRLASRVTGKPMSLISLLDGERQWFKSRYGMELQEAPRQISFCDKAIQFDDITVVPDARKDPLFSSSPLVTGRPNIRFYAGCPLCLPDGAKIGTLSVLDTQPDWPDALVQDHLNHIGKAVERELVRSAAQPRDSLTGLPEKHLFRQEAEAAIALCRQLQRTTLVLSMRLKTLASMNRNHGWAHGDQLLADLADCCEQTLATADLTGRSRGTEITAIFMAAPERDILSQARRLQSAIARRNENSPSGEPSLDPEIRLTLVAAKGVETRLESILELESSGWTLQPGE